MPALNAAGLADMILGYRRAKILFTAAYLDIFSCLDRPQTAGSLARRLKLDLRAAEIFLDALAAMGCLEKNGSRSYRNAPVSSRFLVRRSPEYLGHNLKYQEILWDAWGELRRCLEKGGAIRPLRHWLTRHDGFVEEYIRGMSDIARRPAEEVATIVDASDARDLIDVGAGPGVYSLAFLRRNPRLNATLLDLPETLRITRGILGRRADVRGRLRLKSGDYLKDSLGSNCCDIVLLSHITHDESAQSNRLLIDKSYRALRPGGRVVIHDFMLEPSRTSPEFGALFAVHMLTYTSGGRTYTAQEYARWLREAGFKRLSRHAICAGAPNASYAMLGYKDC